MNLADTLALLRQQHDSTCVYRGQVREYPGPLVPSAFRRVVVPTPSEGLPVLPATLRGVKGVKLVEHRRSGDGVPDLSAVEHQQHRLREIICNSLGYGLGQVVCQQAGLRSEALDVTIDPEVAAFFASHDWNESDTGPFFSPFVAQEGPPPTGIIYRWRCAKPDVTIENLRTWNHIRCPPFLPSVDILKCFPSCTTVDEFHESLERFRDWLANGRLLTGTANRPIQLLRLPAALTDFARTVRQSAALLVPDTLVYRAFYETMFPEIELPEHGFWDGPAMIEDFARSRDVETFRFEHEPEEVRAVSMLEARLVSRSDIEVALTSGWLRILVEGMFNMLPMDRIMETLGLLGQQTNAERALQRGKVIGMAAEIQRRAASCAAELEDALAKDRPVSPLNQARALAEKCFAQKLWDLCERLFTAIGHTAARLSDTQAYGHSQVRLTSVLRNLDRIAEATTVAEEFVQFCEAAHERVPSTQTMGRLVGAYHSLVNIWRWQDATPGLKGKYLDLIDRVAAIDDAEAKMLRATARFDLGSLTDKLSDFAASLDQYRAAIQDIDSCGIDDAGARRLRANATFNVANCLEKTGAHAESQRTFESLAESLAASEDVFAPSIERLARRRLKPVNP